MRVLVTTTGGAGHFGPLVPFVDALVAAGDEVLILYDLAAARR
jgi:UDP-N-acetylglucosamine:LPS N-acetylglucosamine transferase